MVLHTSFGSFLPFLFYDLPTEHYLLWGEPNPRKSAETCELFGGKIATLETTDAYPRVWLVVALDHNVEYQLDQVAWFDAHFSLIEDSNAGDIIIRLYNSAERNAADEE